MVQFTPSFLFCCRENSYFGIWDWFHKKRKPWNSVPNSRILLFVCVEVLDMRITETSPMNSKYHFLLWNYIWLHGMPLINVFNWMLLSTSSCLVPNCTTYSYLTNITIITFLITYLPIPKCDCLLLVICQIQLLKWYHWIQHGRLDFNILIGYTENIPSSTDGLNSYSIEKIRMMSQIHHKNSFLTTAPSWILILQYIICKYMHAIILNYIWQNEACHVLYTNAVSV